MLRITSRMTSARTLLDQMNHLNKLDKIYNDISSRYKLHRPSDDPVMVARAMRLTTEVNVNEMYRQDVLDAHSWTSKNETSMKTLNDVALRIKELTIKAAKDINDKKDTQQIEKEIEQLKQACLTVANDDYMGRYQFSGYGTNKKFALTSPEPGADGVKRYYNNDLYLAGLRYEKMNYNIGVGQKTGINLSGVDVFGNEYFHTLTSAEKNVPFDKVKDTTHLKGDITVTLQKYKLDFTYKDKNGVDQHYDKAYYDADENELKAGTERAADEMEKKRRIESAYETLSELKEKDGPEIKLDTIKLDGEYKSKDIDEIVKDLNKQLRKKLKDKGLNDQVAQFVNNEGKIGFVSDQNYGASITTTGVTRTQTDPITKTTTTVTDDTWLPKQNNMQNPQREKMPFFEMMDRIETFLHEKNVEGLSRMQDVVAYHADNILACEGKAGARMKMYDIMDTRAQFVGLNYKDVLSRVQDTDYSEASVKFSQASYVYSASLSVAAKILQPSLLDFLR